MAQLIDNCFAFGDSLTTAGEALSIMRERLHPIKGTEKVPLSRALGRILAEDIISSREVPPYDNAAVDGYTVSFDGLNPDKDSALPVAGRIAAGHPASRAALQDEAWQIFTGAPMPVGHDTVIMQEDCRYDGHQVFLPKGIRRGINCRRAGEDVCKGAVILRSGQRIKAQHIGHAASISKSELNVFERLRVAIFSTGDEVRDIGDTLDSGCIYDSNRYAISALLTGLGCTVGDLGIVPDCPKILEKALANAEPNFDVIITSAGISMGEEDHVRSAVQALGNLYFWRLAIRPGRPLALGQVGKKPFIGLPGNPVAAIVTFMIFARPALLTLAGCADTAPLTFRVPALFSYNKKAGRKEWIRASITSGTDGQLGAEKYHKDGAGVLSSMANTSGLLELPEELTDIRAGTILNFIPFSEMS